MLPPYEPPPNAIRLRFFYYATPPDAMPPLRPSLMLPAFMLMSRRMARVATPPPLRHSDKHDAMRDMPLTRYATLFDAADEYAQQCGNKRPLTA